MTLHFTSFFPCIEISSHKNSWNSRIIQFHGFLVIFREWNNFLALFLAQIAHSLQLPLPSEVYKLFSYFINYKGKKDTSNTTKTLFLTNFNVSRNGLLFNTFEFLPWVYKKCKEWQNKEFQKFLLNIIQIKLVFTDNLLTKKATVISRNVGICQKTRFNFFYGWVTLTDWVNSN